MHFSQPWLRRAIILFLCLPICGWSYEEAAQWLLRLRGRQLLAEVKSLQVGSSPANLDALIVAWSKRGTLDKGCHGNHQQTCYYFITIRQFLPSVLRADPDYSGKNWLVALVDHTGLRDSAIRVEILTDNGVIIQKSFSESVALPLRDWYIRGGAYVPALIAASSEEAQFRDSYLREHMNPAHPFRYARRFKGPYGLGVSFTVNESASEREKLMAFRFSCITTFIPCREEGQILEEGARLLTSEEKY